MSDFGRPSYDQEARLSRVAELRERATRVREQLAETRATVRSADNAVTVTVGAGGVMQSIAFGPKADGLSPARLGVSVMSAYRAACKQTAERSVEVMSSLVGPDSPTLQLMRKAIPPDDAEEPTVDHKGDR